MYRFLININEKQIDIQTLSKEKREVILRRANRKAVITAGHDIKQKKV
ncbi:hypothetical protein ACTQ6A_05405 [Lachnospiraceae bacterium LCP25S3_G4]